MIAGSKGKFRGQALDVSTTLTTANGREIREGKPAKLTANGFDGQDGIFYIFYKRRRLPWYWSLGSCQPFRYWCEYIGPMASRSRTSYTIPVVKSGDCSPRSFACLFSLDHLHQIPLSRNIAASALFTPFSNQTGMAEMAEKNSLLLRSDPKRRGWGHASFSRLQAAKRTKF